MKFSPLSARRVRAAALLAFAALNAPQVLAQGPRNPQEPRNLLLNGSFETPPVAEGTFASLPAAGPWTALVGNLELQDRLGTTSPFDGDQHLELASLAVVSQVCPTQGGQNYSLSLAYCARPEAEEVAFEVWYAGSLLETVVVPAGSPAVWQHVSQLVLGASASDAVELRCLTSAAIGVLIDDCFLLPFDPFASEQILRNGNFEQDPRIAANTVLANPVFVGWYSPTNEVIEVHDLGSLGNGASGKNVLDLDEARGVAQRVYVVPGRAYQLRFAFSPNPSDDRERSFAVRFGGVLVDTISVPASTTIGWETRTYTVTSNSPLTTVEFQDLAGGPDGALVDAVRLVGTVPEPETDGQLSAYSIVAHTPEADLRLSASAMFARGIASLGDLDGDGVQDIAVGSVGDDDGAPKAGAVWILFLNLDRTVKASAKISEIQGGLVADLQEMEGFGRAVAGLGDLDGDGIPDLAVGANEDDSGGTNAGAAYVLFLNRDGSVKGQHKISALSGDPLDFVPVADSEFGASLANLGDVDSDGIIDLAIGARFSNSVQVCFLNADGTVRASTNLTFGQNGFDDTPTSADDLLGMSCANMGDFDGDGVNDLLVGAYGRVVAGQPQVGGQYLMLLNADGTCKRWLYYGSENINPRSQTIGLHYELGTSCAGPGDIDGDGVRDMIIGAHREGDLFGLNMSEGTNQGAVYVLLLNANGTIKTCQRIGSQAGGLDYRLDGGVRWGESMAALGDHDGNGLTDLAIGSRFVFHTGGVFFCELLGGDEGPPPIRADFGATPLVGLPPLDVAFTDRSFGAVTSWTWDFGDGTTSDQPNPTHTYTEIGTYTVALTITGGESEVDTHVASDSVTVNGPDALPPGVVALGCGLNPPGSFRLLDGTPTLGARMTFAVDNPFGTQAVGSIPSLVASWRADPAYPCGTAVPDLGMSAPGADAERVILAPVLLARTGAPWQGPGIPAPVVFDVPSNASLIGRTLYVQGRLADTTPGAAIPMSLTDGFELTFGP